MEGKEMRELINSTYITLDGVVEHPETWPATGSFSSRGNDIQTELLRTCSALLMGRHTYDGFADVWPNVSGDLADMMNAMPKYVASTTLTDAAWNNTHIIKDDLVAEVEQLKEEAGGDIIQYGFGQVSHALMAAGLLDRLRLWVHPFFVGHGGPGDLLYADTSITQFDLVDTTTLESGVVILDYRTRG
jgi:dihydrofolate reductase